MFIRNGHSARGWLSGHSRRQSSTHASPLRCGRTAIFGAEDLRRWLLGDCRKPYAEFAGTARVIPCEIWATSECWAIYPQRRRARVPGRRNVGRRPAPIGISVRMEWKTHIARGPSWVEAGNDIASARRPLVPHESDTACPSSDVREEPKPEVISHERSRPLSIPVRVRTSVLVSFRLSSRCKTLRLRLRFQR
jgi:hypothetical protein